MIPTGTTQTYPYALYIRPTKERMHDYNQSTTNLERQMLGDGAFLIPNTDTIDDDYNEQVFIWPKTIDGFAPDSYGSYFDDYKENILIAAEKVDEEKTNIFIKTVIPENYLELDSEGQIYRTIVQSYAYEFDKLKNYIDALAYAHNVEYSGEESVPNKFMVKLSNLLGWKLSDSFSELDLFEYLTSDLDGQENSYSYFNLEIWRRILINLVWLYKKKGTRDAIMFIFKLLGAPDNLIKFDEFIYEITNQTPNATYKVDDDGYINYSSSIYAFQEGGVGRGDGNRYINQWIPEFNPVAKVDNTKVRTGETVNGTRQIINSKEISIGLSPAQGIEHDVWTYFQLSGSCWNWGSPVPAFSCLTVPFEYLSYSCDVVAPINISAMTLAQYIDHVYINAIDPTTRKTNSQVHTTWSYPELKNIYLSYYYATCPENNHLTMCKLEAYLRLLEVQLGDYILQLIPATTIFEDGVGTIYKNPVFHRQRFVYREGIDRGSVFQKNFPDELSPKINYATLTVSMPEILDTNINFCSLNSIVINTMTMNIPVIQIRCSVNGNSMITSINSVNNSVLIGTESGRMITERVINH